MTSDPARGRPHQQPTRPTDDGMAQQSAADRAGNASGGLVKAQTAAVVVPVMMVPCLNRRGQSRGDRNNGEKPEGAC